MRDIQRFYILIAAAALLLVLGGTADAFWGGGDSGDLNRSGLDLGQGYDRNTVVKISGPVAVPPRPLAGSLVLLRSATKETIHDGVNEYSVGR